MQADWQKSFEAGQKLRARILYVDAAAKRVCLTLLPRLVSGQSAPGLPKGNTLFQARLLIQSNIKAGIFYVNSHPLKGAVHLRTGCPRLILTCMVKKPACCTHAGSCCQES